MHVQPPVAIYVAPLPGTEQPEEYRPGGFCPTYLGDVLHDQYVIFRKLGFGSTSTVWLAKDVRNSRFVAIKICSALDDEELPTLALHNHPGYRHVQQVLDSFRHQSVNGSHLCFVLEPLGRSLASVLYKSFELRMGWDENATRYDGKPWSINFARRLCYQIVLGLDHLHSQEIAHRDLYPGNVAFALRFDTSTMTENEIQKPLWDGEDISSDDEDDEKDDHPKGEDKIEVKERGEEYQSATEENVAVGSDSEVKEEDDDDNDSDDDSNDSEMLYRQNRRERLRSAREAALASLEPGNADASPDSDEWKRWNVQKSAQNITFTTRMDFEPLSPNDARYLVASSPFSDQIRIGRAARDSISFRALIIDLGSSRPFKDCPNHPLVTPRNFRTPEGLLGLDIDWKADIWSLGLLLWNSVMLRTLIESYSDVDHDREVGDHLRDLAQRIGPVPTKIQSQWPKATDWVDENGIALRQNTDINGDPVEPDDFRYGDMRQTAIRDKPEDMSVEDMDVFLDLMATILKWESKDRPTTKQILAHAWFAKIGGEPGVVHSHNVNQPK